MKVVREKDERSRFDYHWDRFVTNRITHPRQGAELDRDPEAVARAAYEAGWEAAGGEPHASRETCRHPNVTGIAVVPRPCPSCGKRVL